MKHHEVLKQLKSLWKTLSKKSYDSLPLTFTSATSQSLWNRNSQVLALISFTKEFSLNSEAVSEKGSGFVIPRGIMDIKTKSYFGELFIQQSF